MKSYLVVIISLLVALVIATPIFLVGCTSNKYNIEKYPATKSKFDYTIINNLSLSGLDRSLLANEDRGFRGEVAYTLGTEKSYPTSEKTYIEHIEEQLTLYSEDDIKILQCYIYLTEYRDIDLDANAINLIKNYFEILKSKNVKVLLRFAYMFEDKINTDAKDAQIIKHLDQIGKFINDNTELFNDVVYAMQFGLIGLWGEGHGYWYNHNIRKLITKLCNIIPEDIYIMVRTPDILSQVPKQFESRISVHDDFLVGQDHEWGMMSWKDPQYKDLLNKNKHTIADGEMPWGDYKENDKHFPIDGLGFVKQVVGYGLTTLSITHNYKEHRSDAQGTTYHLEKWKTEYLTKAELEKNNLPYSPAMLDNEDKISIYKYLQFHLGYNLGVSNLLTTDNQTSFMINNFGFAAPLEYELEIITDGKKIDIPQKALYMFEQQIITINENVKEIKIKFTHKRSGSTIKLANNLPYIDGYNVINL